MGKFTSAKERSAPPANTASMKCGIPVSTAPGKSLAGQMWAVMVASSAPSLAVKNSNGNGEGLAAARRACASAARKAGRPLAQPANNAAPPADRNRRLEKSAALNVLKVPVAERSG